jgi:hypothetical protein
MIRPLVVSKISAFSGSSTRQSSDGKASLLARAGAVGATGLVVAGATGGDGVVHFATTAAGFMTGLAALSAPAVETGSATTDAAAAGFAVAAL